MSAARDAILGRIRSALADVPTAPAGLAPRAFRRAGTADRATLVEDFAERAGAYKVRVERTDRADAAAAVARILGERDRVRLVTPADFPVNFAPDGFDLVPDEDLDRAVDRPPLGGPV